MTKQKFRQIGIINIKRHNGNTTNWQFPVLTCFQMFHPLPHHIFMITLNTNSNSNKKGNHKNQSCPGLDHKAKHVIRFRTSKILLHHNNDNTYFDPVLILLVDEGNIKIILELLWFPIFQTVAKQWNCIKGYLDIVTPWMPSGPFLRNTNNLSWQYKHNL